MKRGISLVLAGAALFMSAVSCGDKAEESVEKTSTLSGDYLSILHWERPLTPITGDIDDHIAWVLSENNEYNKNYNEPFVRQRRLRFEEDSFQYSLARGDIPKIVFSGTFSENAGKLSFSYQQTEVMSKTCDTWVYLIDDEPETYDDDIVIGKKEASEEEYMEALQKKLKSSWIDTMKKLDAGGSYYTRFSPDWYMGGQDSSFALIPAFHVINDYRGDFPCSMYHFGDMLGFETYGLTANEDYVQGDDFTLDFDQLKVYREDPFFSYTTENGSDDTMEELTRKISSDYGLESNNSDLTSAVSFSGGKWEWKNSEGGLINNGSYQESKKYPGLIAVYADSSSKHNEESLRLPPGMSKVMLYIADDGRIFYPYFAKYDK